MKEAFGHRSLSGFAALLVLLASGGAFAQASDSGSAPDHPHHRHGFGLGLCVGQTLAQQGIILPPHVRGQPHNDTNHAAFEAAIQSCKAKFAAAAASAPGGLSAGLSASSSDGSAQVQAPAQ